MANLKRLGMVCTAAFAVGAAGAVATPTLAEGIKKIQNIPYIGAANVNYLGYPYDFVYLDPENPAAPAFKGNAVRPEVFVFDVRGKNFTFPDGSTHFLPAGISADLGPSSAKFDSADRMHSSATEFRKEVERTFGLSLSVPQVASISASTSIKKVHERTRKSENRTWVMSSTVEGVRMEMDWSAITNSLKGMSGEWELTSGLSGKLTMIQNGRYVTITSADPHLKKWIGVKGTVNSDRSITFVLPDGKPKRVKYDAKRDALIWSEAKGKAELWKRIARRGLVGLSSEFRRAVADLGSPASYRGFIARWGTHYGKKVVYGGRAYFKLQLSKFAARQLNLTEKTYKAKISGTYKKVEAEFSAESRTTKSYSSEEKAIRENIKIESRGGDGFTTAAGFNDWIKSVRSKPTAIVVELARYDETLLNKDWFPDDPKIDDKRRALKVAIKAHFRKHKKNFKTTGDFFQFKNIHNKWFEIHWRKSPDAPWMKLYAEKFYKKNKFSSIVPLSKEVSCEESCKFKLLRKIDNPDPKKRGYEVSLSNGHNSGYWQIPHGFKSLTGNRYVEMFSKSYNRHINKFPNRGMEMLFYFEKIEPSSESDSKYKIFACKNKDCHPLFIENHKKVPNRLPDKTAWGTLKKHELRIYKISDFDECKRTLGTACTFKLVPTVKRSRTVASTGDAAPSATGDAAPAKPKIETSTAAKPAGSAADTSAAASKPKTDTATATGTAAKPKPKPKSKSGELSVDDMTSILRE